MSHRARSEIFGCSRTDRPSPIDDQNRTDQNRAAQNRTDQNWAAQNWADSVEPSSAVVEESGLTAVLMRSK